MARFFKFFKALAYDLQKVKKYLDYYINSSIHVALAVVALSLITTLNFEGQVNLSLLLYTFFGSVVGYNFVKYAGLAGLHYRSLARGLKNIQIFSFFCLAGLFITSFFIDVKILLWSMIFGGFTILYALPVFSRRNLRSISGLKIFIIALVWAGVTVILPVIGVKNTIFEDLVLELFQRFLLVLVWILPFEIRDLKYDLEQLGTIPQRIGITYTKIFGLITLLVVVLLEPLKSNAGLASTISLGMVCIVTGIFVLGSKEDQSRYYSSFWVEAIPVIWLIALMLLRII